LGKHNKRSLDPTRSPRYALCFGETQYNCLLPFGDAECEHMLSEPSLAHTYAYTISFAAAYVVPRVFSCDTMLLTLTTVGCIAP